MTDLGLVPLHAGLRALPDAAPFRLEAGVAVAGTRDVV